MPKKRTVSNAKFDVKTYDQVNINIRKDSGIIEALAEMEQKTGMKRSEYTKIAIMEAMQAEGIEVMLNAN